jgi:hypothetical protein
MLDSELGNGTSGGSAPDFREQLQERCRRQRHPTLRFKKTCSLTFGSMTTLYQMFSQAIESEDPNAMRAKIQDFEKTFEQTYRRKMTDDELSIVETAKEIVERELGAEKLRTKAA